MPERFLLQILRSLVTNGILSSTRGVDGGYTLERSPQDISLLEIIEAIEGPFGPKMPKPESTNSAARQRRLREALDGVAANLRRQLHGIKLSDIAGSPSLARLA
jgi:Rrf2 family protein